jgi:hypothetical protein
MTLLKGANLGLMFLLELAVYGAVAWWGFTLPGGPIVRLLAGLGAPALFAVVWAVFGSPKAKIPLRGLGRAVLEVLWFGGGALAFLSVAGLATATVFAAAFVVNAVLRIVWHQ